MRRIVTGHDSEGRSVIVSDGLPPRTTEYKSVPGMSISVVWATEPGQPVSRAGTDSTADVVSVVPSQGGNRLMWLVFPPDAVVASPDFDGAGFVAEHRLKAPGLAELFEADGMHTTPTVDYSIVVEGEIWLETDEQKLTRLEAGDVVIQNGTRHGWRNRSDKRAVVMTALIGSPTEESR